MPSSASPAGSAAFALCLVASASLYVAALRLRAQALGDSTPRDLQIFRDICFGSVMGFVSCRSAQMMVESLAGEPDREDGNDCNGDPLTPLVLLFGVLADVFLGTCILDRRWRAFCSTAGVVMAAAIPHILWRSGAPEHDAHRDRYPTERWLSTLLAALGSAMAIMLGAIEIGGGDAIAEACAGAGRRSGAKGRTFGSLYDLERERCAFRVGCPGLPLGCWPFRTARYARAPPDAPPAQVEVPLREPPLIRSDRPVGQAPWAPPELRFQQAVVVGTVTTAGEANSPH